MDDKNVGNWRFAAGTDAEVGGAWVQQHTRMIADGMKTIGIEPDDYFILPRHAWAGTWSHPTTRLVATCCYSTLCGDHPGYMGNVAVVYGDASLALKELGWKAELGLTDMCEDSWRWISNNPNGFD